MLDVRDLDLPGVKLLKPKRHGDARGFFVETFNANAFGAADLPTNFVQDNLSRYEKRGTIRGLHYQSPPAQQGKLIRVARGRVLDVIVDLRHSSPAFGRHMVLELTADSLDMLWVPAGLAHGFCTMAAETEVEYKVDNYYSPAHDLGIFWADSTLKIDWPVEAAAAILSAKDQKLPPFDPQAAYFP